MQGDLYAAECLFVSFNEEKSVHRFPLSRLSIKDVSGFNLDA